MSFSNDQPHILRSTEDMRTFRRSINDRVGFVPTMGALHAGHAQLLRRLRPLCDRLVLSIFVNPTQFGPTEDLSRYPRTFAADLALAQAEGVDAVFFPTPEQIYPVGYSTYVEENSLTAPLCGKFRPGHFKGVATVVLKLFNLVQPHTAYFGLKDAQQFFVLHKMARDLDLDVSVEGVATVRETDGLAMSSRNRYLTADERAQAPQFYSVLQNTARELEKTTDAAQILHLARQALERGGLKLQYLECLALPDFSPLATPSDPLSSVSLSAHQPYLLAFAGHLGSTRLIDNVILRPEKLAEHGIRVHL